MEQCAHNTRGLPVTRWSLVARAGDESSEEKRRALEELLSIYMPALKAHLMVRMQLSPDLSEDLLQDFVARKILERDLIAGADKENGKFRTFLLTCLDRFVFNQLRDEKTYQRHREITAEYLRAARLACDAAPVGPEPFDVAWARRVIARAMDGMEQECEASGHSVLWAIFDGRVLGPLLRDEAPVAYEALVGQWALASVKQASNLLITAKRMYARILQRIVSQYCDDADIMNEISELKDILSGARA